MQRSFSRIVHFDLKGAPPKMQYFEKVLRKIKTWGATGVLLEWEDTFPYSESLSHLGSESNSGGDDMYSAREVQRIFAVCKALGLEAIQLVQTMGHMEFVLKHPRYEHLREYIRSPAIICPEKQESKALVKHMVMQALTMQPNAKYFHIGADEVCHIAYCEDCCKNIKRKYPLDHWRVYLNHIQDLVMFIKEQRPNITILMWDDMIRVMDADVLEEYPQLCEFVQPVVWNYETRENFRFPPGMWTTYTRYFPAVWAASAFKGANGSNQLVCSVLRYVRNQDAWIKEISDVRSYVNFAGVIFTGWSRYDHFATLCELLPTSLNSLVNCIKSFLGGSVKNYAELHSENSLPAEQWPGKAVADCVQKIAALNEAHLRLVCGDLKTTWLNNWQLENGFLNIFQVDNIENYVYRLIEDINEQKAIAARELSVTCGPRACNEWLHTNVDIMEMGLEGVLSVIKYARRFDQYSSEYIAPTLEPSPSVFQHVPPSIAQTPMKEEPDPMKDEGGPSGVELDPSMKENDPSGIEPDPSKVEDDSSKNELDPSKVEPDPLNEPGPSNVISGSPIVEPPTVIEYAPPIEEPVPLAEPIPTAAEPVPPIDDEALSTDEHVT